MKTNSQKKAQLAVETLLIYGIAILVVMLAIGALIGFGILDLGALLPDQCQISDALICENYVVTEDGPQLELRNVLGKNIQNFTVTIEGQGDNEGLWGENGICRGEYTDLLVNGDISAPLEMDCAIKVPKGKKIQGVLTINYYTVGSKISKLTTGKIRTTVS